MSSSTVTKCDVCGAVQPDDYDTKQLWVGVREGYVGKQFDLCPDCGGPLVELLEKSTPSAPANLSRLYAEAMSFGAEA